VTRGGVPPTYCGAVPPQGRETGTCVHLSSRHRTPHHNLDGLWWTDDCSARADSDGRIATACGIASPRLGTLLRQREWMAQHLTEEHT
jgi:hypothetical protein